MFELSWWMVWFVAELVVVLIVVLVLQWLLAVRTCVRLRAAAPTNKLEVTQEVEEVAPVLAPPEVPRLEEHELDGIDSGEATELRSQLGRSLEEMSEVAQASQELATQITAELMSLLENQAMVQALVARINAMPEVEGEVKELVGELVERLREADGLVVEGQQRLDQVDSSLQGLVSELARYDGRSGFQWSRLRPSIDGINRLIRTKAEPDDSDEFDDGTGIELPPALADAIDQAII